MNNNSFNNSNNNGSLPNTDASSTQSDRINNTNSILQQLQDLMCNNNANDIAKHQTTNKNSKSETFINLISSQESSIENKPLSVKNNTDINANNKVLLNDGIGSKRTYSSTTNTESSDLNEDFILNLINENESEKKSEKVSQDESKILQSTTISSSKYQQAFNEELRECDDEFKKEVENPAIEYDFELDQFQKQAIMHVEKNESLLISAHTSSGKTVIAEYAIAKSIQNLKRAIYTSPIKSLSNQKFRDFKRTFGDVGVITGDVSINSSASCLIMTTEILRSMLYKHDNDETIKQVQQVIFDEIHYINDFERGVVQEEVIIMLPPHINIIMLSATVSNTMEFADQVGRTKLKNIQVISTLKRPVSLKHYIWNDSLNNMDKQDLRLHEIMRDETWNGEQFFHRDLEPPIQETQHQNILPTTNTNYVDFVQYIQNFDLLPVVVFVFSKKKCEQCVDSLSDLDLNSNIQDKEKTRLIMNYAKKRLYGSDLDIEQLKKTEQLVERGLGVHHSGLLPIIKEVVEILFARGLIKVLFATETFAMGVNFPARTVVFHELRKHDGRQQRWLLPGEYIQMSGRAGRRGIDEFGTVIINYSCMRSSSKFYFGDSFEYNTDSTSEAFFHEQSGTVIKQILTGTPNFLVSQFRLTYNMILNLLILKIDDLKVEDMIGRSFGGLNLKLIGSKGLKEITSSNNSDEEDVNKIQYKQNTNQFTKEASQYQQKLTRQIRKLQAELLQVAANDLPSGPFIFQPGRLTIARFNIPSTNSADIKTRTDDEHIRDEKFGFALVLSINQTKPFEKDRLDFRNTFLGLMLYPKPKNFSETTKNCQNTDQHYITSNIGGDEWMWRFDDKISFASIDSILDFIVDEIQFFDQEQIRQSFDSPSNTLVDLNIEVIQKIVNFLNPFRQNLIEYSINESFLNSITNCVEAKKQESSSHSQVSIQLPLPLNLLQIINQDLTNLLSYADRTRLRSRPRGDMMGRYDDRGKIMDLEDYVDHRLDKFDQLWKLRRKFEHHQKFEITKNNSNLSEPNEKMNNELSLKSDFNRHLAVLERLGYIDKDRRVLVKGRVACEINTCSSLILTELIFAGVLTNLSSEYCLALLSCLICQNKEGSSSTKRANGNVNQSQFFLDLDEKQSEAYSKLYELARQLGTVQAEIGIISNAQNFIDENLNIALMQVVYEQGRGMNFGDVCRLTPIHEGSIVRTINRLDETCRDIKNASRIIGEPSLFRKMEEASSLIKRDIVFASSLYLS